ncbi:MAG: hypothetical protein AAF328_03265 [Planctomycetota bacterium]
MYAQSLFPILRRLLAAFLLGGVASAVIAEPASDSLAAARASVAVALDAQNLEPRTAALHAAASHYRAALTDPDLAPRDARLSRQALRAIATLLDPSANTPAYAEHRPEMTPVRPAQSVVPITPAPPKYSRVEPNQHALIVAGAASPVSAPASPPNSSPATSNAAIAPVSPSAQPTDPPTALAERRTLAVALALLDAEPEAFSTFRAILRRGANHHGRFGAGLSPPASGADALHTLIAVAALTAHGPLQTDHAQTLAAVLLLEQSTTGGWRDPLTPIEQTGDQALPTAANLFTLRLLAETPGLPPSLQRDLAEARHRGQMRLLSIINRGLTNAAWRLSTFADNCFEHALAALNTPDAVQASEQFRRALAEQLRNHHATQPLH